MTDRACTSLEADVATILSVLPQQEHTRLVSLMEDAPRLIERLVPGERAPHRSTLLRAATRGIQGVRLRVCCQGRRRMTCAAWLARFWMEVAAAKLAPVPVRSRRGGRKAGAA